MQNRYPHPLIIGVFAGSFNPIHLGHALLAITVQQTKLLHKVILVPVYKHAVKKDLLPFEDRVAMCRLAVAPFARQYKTGYKKDVVEVCTIEKSVGASNGAMLRELKKGYPPGTKLMYIAGDDFLRWFERPKGIETLKEVDGLIIQRRLHKQVGDRFYKQPIDETHIRSVCAKLNLELEFIYGELPHFSSTLVRRAPGTWRSFLPQSVTSYLDERPHLLKKLHANLEADAAKEIKEKRKEDREIVSGSEWVMRGLEAVHSLQIERGCTALWISTGTGKEKLEKVKEHTDALLSIISNSDVDQESLESLDEVQTLMAELQQISIWLNRDREVFRKKHYVLVETPGVKGWKSRLDIVGKFNAKIDVLIGATIRAIKEIREVNLKSNIAEHKNTMDDLPDLLQKWCHGKEALGRVRAFVCAGGSSAPITLRSSVKMRELLNQTIATKNRRLERVLSLQEGMSSRVAAPEALYRLLEKVTESEWSLMGCFASSTPLSLIHRLLSTNGEVDGTQRNIPPTFDVNEAFQAFSSAIDFLLSFAKALAASGCASID